VNQERLVSRDFEVNNVPVTSCTLRLTTGRGIMWARLRKSRIYISNGSALAQMELLALNAKK